MSAHAMASEGDKVHILVLEDVLAHQNTNI